MIFKVEKRIKDSKDKFTQVYEGNTKNCLIIDLKINTSYEIRLCWSYGNLVGSWTNIYNFKTYSIDSIDSIILNNLKKKWIFTKNIWMKWIYKNGITV